jgi:hypothetical protein
VNFVADFEKYCRELESPDSYIQWSAYCAISAVMRDNLFLQFAYEKIYPNIYVILYATSGATRKGPPVKIAGSLIKEVGNTKFLGGRFTIQAAIKTLSEIGRDNNNNPIKGGACIMYSEEIAALFAGDGKATIDILTEWYEYHEKWENNILSNEGTQVVNNVCVSILAATNDVLFKKVFTSDAIYGGLLARIFLVVESSRRKRNSRMYSQVDTASERGKLVAHLKRLAGLRGAITPTDEAREYYDHWYNNLDDSARDRTGVLHRMHTSVLKLALILAASEYTFNYTVEKKHIEKAIDLCGGLLKNYKQLDTGTGPPSRSSSAAKEVLRLLSEDKTGNGLTKVVLLRKLFGIADHEEFEKACEALTKLKYLDMKKDRYILTQDFFDAYESNKGKKEG